MERFSSGYMGDRMTNRVLALAATAAGGARKEKAEEASGVVTALELGQLRTSEQMFRIASRLVMSMKVGDQIVACTGIAEDDPSASFALHTAVALARLGHGPVLLLDANFHSASLHELASIPLIPGLAEVLNDSAVVDVAVRSTVIDGLEILPAGNVSGIAKAALSSVGLGKRLEEFRRYRFVVIDVGAMLASAQSLLVASLCDVIVASLASGERSRNEVARLKSETELLKARFLGVVLTEK
jgi:Mrp family chromosome partitioning ATPase